MNGARPITPVANFQCQVGENPLWNERDGRVTGGHRHRAPTLGAPRHARHRCFYTGDVVGGFTLQADGSLLLFEADRISVLDPESGARRVLRSGIDPDMKRFNDVIADPEGRVFAGTIGQSVNSGGLYRVDRDDSIRLPVQGHGLRQRHGLFDRSFAVLLDL